MKIEEGKRYVTRDGSITDVMGNTGGDRWPFRTYITCPDGTRYSRAWTVYGEYVDHARPHKLDLVKEYVEPPAEPEIHQSSYVQQLAIKHTRPEVIKLDNDPAFAEAAAKLSERLAHALLEDPRLILDRRKKQTVMLWNAACILLSRAGIGIIYEDDTLELME